MKAGSKVKAGLIPSHTTSFKYRPQLLFFYNTNAEEEASSTVIKLYREEDEGKSFKNHLTLSYVALCVCQLLKARGWGDAGVRVYNSE
jgi:hypothetical protein